MSIEQYLYRKPIMLMIALFLMLFVGLLNTGKAEAALEDGSTYPSQVISNLNTFCSTGKNGGPQTSAQTTWLSPVGSLSDSGVTVPSSVSTIQLRLNVVTKRCWRGFPSGIFADRFRPKAFSANIPGIGTRIIDISGLSDIIVAPPPAGGTLDYSRESWVFNVDITGMSSSGTVVVTATTKQFSWRNDGGGMMCIMGFPQTALFGNGVPPPGVTEAMVLAEFERVCPNTSPSYPIVVNLIPDGGVSPVGSGTGCTTLNGWASDRDNLAVQINVHVYVDGPAGSGAWFGSFATSGSGHTFAIDISGVTGSTPRTFYIYGIGVNSAGAIDGYNSFLGSVTPVNCERPPTCNISGLGAAEVGSVYSFNVNIRDNEIISPSATPYTVSINAGGLPFGPTPPGSNNGTIGSAGGTAISSWAGNIPLVTTLGPRNIIANVAYGTGGRSIQCSMNINVVSKPYISIYGGDVSVGKAAPRAGDTVCTENTSAQILGWQRLTGLTYTGAGTQIAIFAINTIDQFASGQERSTTNPKSLTFANTGNATASSTYGGGLASTNISCAANYWSPSGSSTPVTINPATNGTFQSTGNTNINVNPAGIGAGHDVTIYVNGNAYISGNILYDPTRTSYTNIDQIPSFRLIVQGNIYVAPTVTELHGTFVAVDNGSGTAGKFYTCSSGFGAPTPAELDGPCLNNFLRVYGSVIADTIKLNRTGGTLSQATVSDTYNHNVHPPGSRTGPAERFIYTPESWLTSEFNTGGDAGSYKNQPPVL